MIGYGLHEIAGVLTAGYDAAQGVNYNGPLNNSLNSAGGDLNNGALDYVGGDRNWYNMYNPVTTGQ